VSGSAFRPPTPKGQSTHDRIVGAATELIYLYGLSGTTLETVRTASSTSGSDISCHFRTRRELVCEVLAARRNEILAFHADERFGSFDTIEALRAWADACIASLESMDNIGGCLYGSLVGELLPMPDAPLRAMITNAYDAWISIFRSGLSAMYDRGQLRQDADPLHLATALVCTHQGGAVLSQTLGTYGPMRIALEAAVAYVYSFVT
jgi:TetR/AcrR family transcriptional repressor of nem operon